jgi:hypothetical protein
VAGIWIFGCAVLIAWGVLSLRAKMVTPRTLALGFLVAIMIFLVELLVNYWANTPILGILVTIMVAVVGAEVALIKSSWLDFRIMLRR